MKLSIAQQACVKLCGKAMQELNMLEPNSRIGVAVSGGVDSFVLLQVLKLRQRIVPFKFEIMAIHLNAGFDTTNHAPLFDWTTDNDISSHIELTEHGLRAHSAENRKASACFYCAMLRRNRLFELCKKYKLTHLAFGHNADDLVHTFFMNLWQNGRVDGLNPCDDFFGGKLKVIRPLILVEKSDIQKAAKRWKLPIWQNPCPSAGKTKRTAIEQELKQIFEQNKLFKRNCFNALGRWQMNKLTEMER